MRTLKLFLALSFLLPQLQSFGGIKDKIDALGFHMHSVRGHKALGQLIGAQHVWNDTVVGGCHIVDARIVEIRMTNFPFNISTTMSCKEVRKQMKSLNIDKVKGKPNAYSYQGDVYMLFYNTDYMLEFGIVRASEKDFQYAKNHEAYELDDHKFKLEADFQHYWNNQSNIIYISSKDGRCLSGACYSGKGLIIRGKGFEFKGDFSRGKPVFGTYTIKDLDGSRAYSGKFKDGWMEGISKFVKAFENKDTVDGYFELNKGVPSKCNLTYKISDWNYRRPYQYDFRGEVDYALNPIISDEIPGIFSIDTNTTLVTVSVTYEDLRNFDNRHNQQIVQFRIENNVGSYEGEQLSYLSGKSQQYHPSSFKIIDRKGNVLRTSVPADFGDLLSFNRQTVWNQPESGLTQRGHFSFKTGFEGEVVSTYSNSPVGTKARGNYKSGYRDGVHQMIDRDEILSQGTYHKGRLVDGEDVYLGLRMFCEEGNKEFTRIKLAFEKALKNRSEIIISTDTLEHGHAWKFYATPSVDGDINVYILDPFKSLDECSLRAEYRQYKPNSILDYSETKMVTHADFPYQVWAMKLNDVPASSNFFDRLELFFGGSRKYNSRALVYTTYAQ